MDWPSKDISYREMALNQIRNSLRPYYSSPTPPPPPLPPRQTNGYSRIVGYQSPSSITSTSSSHATSPSSSGGRQSPTPTISSASVGLSGGLSSPNRIFVGVARGTQVQKPTLQTAVAPSISKGAPANTPPPQASIDKAVPCQLCCNNASMSTPPPPPPYREAIQKNKLTNSAKGDPPNAQLATPVSIPSRPPPAPPVNSDLVNTVESICLSQVGALNEIPSPIRSRGAHPPPQSTRLPMNHGPPLPPKPCLNNLGQSTSSHLTPLSDLASVTSSTDSELSSAPSSVALPPGLIVNETVTATPVTTTGAPRRPPPAPPTSPTSPPPPPLPPPTKFQINGSNNHNCTITARNLHNNAYQSDSDTRVCSPAPSSVSTATTSSSIATNATNHTNCTNNSSNVTPVEGKTTHESPIPPRKELSQEKESRRREFKVRNYPPAAYKFFMEQHVENVVKCYQQRERRRLQLEQEMQRANLNEEDAEQMRKMLHQKESNYIRLKRAKMNKSMFQKIATIGIGAFGEVALVKKVDTNQLYAMKTLRKEDVLKVSPFPKLCSFACYDSAT